jgi:L-ascorbate metabolism protein UlaG (beta-lactamase superfamily)
LKVRYLGHSCVEIKGRHHILIDPDFTREPDPGVEYICVTHAHKDHIGRVAEVPTGIVLASADVCEIAAQMGVPRERLHPVKAGDEVAGIKVLPGYSQVGGFFYTIVNLMFRWRMPDPGGTPLSFLVEDDITLLHIGDAHDVPLLQRPDLLCLPWRTPPFQPARYKTALMEMANRFAPRYILPIHYDLNHTIADPHEINGRTNATVLDGHCWYGFENKKRTD